MRAFELIVMRRRSVRPRRRIGLLLAALAAPALLSGCFDAPARDRLVVTIGEDLAVRVRVETNLALEAQAGDGEREIVTRLVDAYALGRDEWLRGLGRSGATGVTHVLEEDESGPLRIVREADLPSIESLERVMPDAIASFRLSRQEREGTASLRIVHIDAPAPVRENHRRVDRELNELAIAGFRLSERWCDFYDHLAERPGRRAPLVRALLHDGESPEVLDPEETVLLTGLLRAIDETFALVVGEASKDGAPDRLELVPRISFSAFEHQFCVRLPRKAVRNAGLELAKESNEREFLYCAGWFSADSLLWALFPESDPSHEDLARADAPESEPPGPEELEDDPDGLLRAPFTCVRMDDPMTLKRRLWETILPAPIYELTWSDGPDPLTPPFASSPPHRGW